MKEELSLIGHQLQRARENLVEIERSNKNKETVELLFECFERLSCCYEKLLGNSGLFYEAKTWKKDG